MKAGRSPGGRRRRFLIALLRDPIGMGRKAWTRKLEGTLLVISATPAGFASWVAAPVAGVAERLARSRPGLWRVPELAVIARLASGRQEETAALASQLGTSAATPPATRRRLA